jgi:hypothetical protein
MRGDIEVAIKLSRAQLAQVVRTAGGGSCLTAPPAGAIDLRALEGVLLPHMNDVSLSRSTFRALLVLYAFPPDGAEREVTDVAKQLGLSPSTTHRYVRTWTAIGLLEQDPESRQYRRPPTASGPEGPNCNV